MADRFDHAVAHPALGRLGDVFARNRGVRCFHAEGAAHGAAALHEVDAEHARGAHDEGGFCGQEADGAETDDRNRCAALDVGIARAEPGGGEGVGHHQRLVGGDAVRDFLGIEIGCWYAHAFGLTALEFGREAVAAGGIVFAPVDDAGEAGTALAAAHRGRDHHLVADLQLAHAAADLHHFADRLVADAIAGVLREGFAMIDMQVAAADGALVDLDDRVAVIVEFGVLHRLVGDVAGAAIDEGFHGTCPLCGA